MNVKFCYEIWSQIRFLLRSCRSDLIQSSLPKHYKNKRKNLVYFSQSMKFSSKVLESFLSIAITNFLSDHSHLICMCVWRQEGGYFSWYFMTFTTQKFIFESA